MPQYTQNTASLDQDAVVSVERDQLALELQLSLCHLDNGPWRAMAALAEIAIAFAVPRLVSLLVIAIVAFEVELLLR